jgi:hypothetical protein
MSGVPNTETEVVQQEFEKKRQGIDQVAEARTGRG